MTDARDSRRELAAVALALLLPIPLFVASGLRLPVPAAVERGLASLAPGSFDSDGAFDSGGLDSAVVQAPPAEPEPLAGATAVEETDEPTTAAVSGSSGTSSIATGTGSASAGGSADETPGSDAPPGGTVPLPGADDEPTPPAGGADPGDETGAQVPLPAPSLAVDGSSDPPATSVSLGVAGGSADVTVDEDSVAIDAAGTSVDVPVPPVPAPLPTPPLSFP